MGIAKRSQRRGGWVQRGNSMLEFAFVLLPLMAVLLAVVDYSMAIFMKVTLQHAVREGTRYAVTWQTLAGKGQDASIKAIVQKNAMGFLSGTTGAAKINIQYYLADTFTATTANDPGNIIDVSVQNYTWKWIAPLYRQGGNIAFTVHAMDRMEGLPGGTTPPAR
jgi:Flp pilus assembly protein TadG